MRLSFSAPNCSRLASITWADKIVCIGGGVVVEAGNHEELLANDDSLYTQLWNNHQNNQG